MKADLTNLLPRERQRALTHGYIFRAGVMACLLAAVVVVVHGLLLVPSYIYLAQQTHTRAAELEALQASSLGSTEKEVTGRIALLSAHAQSLLAAADKPTASNSIRLLLAEPRPGIVIRGFTFSPKGGQGETRMTVSGIASSREALRAYVQALGALPYVTRADLPISAYAKEQDIDFLITLTGSFTP